MKNTGFNLDIPPERNFNDGSDYYHICNDCNEPFIGHKDRRICKLCEKKRIADISKEFKDLLRSISRRLELLTIINEGSFTKLLDESSELNADSLKIHLTDIYQCDTLVYLLSQELPRLMLILSTIPKR